MPATFPSSFYWGTATASYQIEGATREDGRGESIWDRFAATPTKIITGETGDIACDSYHRYLDDIALMQEMGLNAYRFSTAWPRIMPAGDGAVNPAGLDYYERLVDALLAAGVTPFVTLYHWDLPQALQEQGGWGDRRTVDAFLRYAEATVGRLGDRVKHWITHNEPWCVSFLSHEIGMHAPGLRDRALAIRVAHHVLVSHGLAVPIIRTLCPNAQVGITLNFEPGYPATDSAADAAATALHDAKFNQWFLHPITGRHYPELAVAEFGADMCSVTPEDMATIAAPLDFLGVNYYTRKLCHDGSAPAGKLLHRRNPEHMMARGWELWPQALAELLTKLHRDYGFTRLYVTENGAMYDDVVWEGQVHDPARQAYIAGHLAAVADVIAAGVPVGGYFCWSLLDNFEWASGTRDRFGLAYTDFATQRRFLKDSGQWYGRVARANALVD